MNWTRPRFFLGFGKNQTVREVFKCDYIPDFDSHGDKYNCVVGPFKTKRGAIFMRDYGQGNPHCRDVYEAERLGLIYGTGEK